MSDPLLSHNITGPLWQAIARARLTGGDVAGARQARYNAKVVAVANKTRAARKRKAVAA